MTQLMKLKPKQNADPQMLNFDIGAFESAVVSAVSAAHLWSNYPVTNHCGAHELTHHAAQC